MELPAVEPTALLQDPGKISARPLRILYMRNLICQHHWNRDFDRYQDRWNVYGHEFGYENRNCYFLIDHGHSESPEDPPVLWYKWTGKSLIAIQQPLPAKIQSKLRAYPFSRRPIQRLPSKTPAQYDAATYRRIIRSKLRCDMRILDQDVRFLMTHPEDARWLKDNIEPRFWSKIHLEQSEAILK
ncbi:hypothetical protein F5Y09DRAFT_330513 [Xylaria sp. FL1042]|nr:hypothetical protein F5Y09DRAFT_330513 [Xylaria sp. FL1042]